MNASSQPSEPVRLCGRCGASQMGATAECTECGGPVVELHPPEDALIGRTLDDRFEIRSLLGQGGMGAVYRAYQRSTDREVAIKVIEPRRMRDVGAIRRFLREAKLASQLAQPNLVSVFDFGQSRDGYLYLVMELVKGRTLGELVRADGLLGHDRAVRIAVQLCDALEVAHAQSIVHRDLKPANVMVLDDPPGRDLVKVLDFGIAKTPDSSITDSGLLIGTPRYMSPQALAGGEAIPEWDLYAVGVMLIELTSGVTPFPYDNLHELMAQKLVSPVMPPNVPALLRPIIEALVTSEPAQRISSASELRRRLATLGSQDDDAEVEVSSVRAPTVVLVPTIELTRSTRSRGRLIAVLVVALLGAGAAAAIVAGLETSGTRDVRTPATSPAPAASPASVASPAPVAPAGSSVPPTPPPTAAQIEAPPAPKTSHASKHQRAKPATTSAAPSPPALAAPIDPCKQKPRPAECAPF